MEVSLAYLMTGGEMLRFVETKEGMGVGESSTMVYLPCNWHGHWFSKCLMLGAFFVEDQWRLIYAMYVSS